MSEPDFILFANDFDGKGGGNPLVGDDIQKKLRAKDLAWVHMDATNPNTEAWLSENLDYLDPIIIDALLASETRPRVTFFERGAMVILKGMNLQENADPEDMISIRLWIDDHRIISLQRRSLMAVNDIREAMAQGEGPKSAADFLARLCQRLFERMQPTLFDITDQIDEIEEQLLDTNLSKAMRHEVNDIRRKTLIFKRYLTPQRDVMQSLRASDLSWIKSSHNRIFQENQDRLTRYLEDLDALRERAQIIKEEYVTMMSDKLNRNTYALSLIAGVFLPLGFLTGLFGINVGGMPGTENPMGFWIIVGLCVASGVGFLGLFKLLKWL